MKPHAASMKKYWFGLLLTNILLYWAVLPLLSHGYFPMHDDTQVARVIVMGNALKEKQFPVRLVDDLGYGYGYPIFNFYSPLPYYVGGALYAAGIDAVIATKIMFLIPFVLGASFLYLFLAPVYGISASIAGSVLFSYAPYHAIQVYIRGSVGEYWAIAFVPLLLFALHRCCKTTTYSGVAIGSLAIAGILTSHTILAVLILSLYVSFFIGFFLYQTGLKKVQWNVYRMAILTLILGLGISAFFWLPAFLEMKYTSVSSMISLAQSGFYDHFVCPIQLWSSPWGFGGSAPGCISDGISFKLGKLHVLVAVLSLIVFLWHKRSIIVRSTPFQFSIGVALCIVSVFGMLEYSSPIWRVFPFTSFIQYPWRLLSLAMLATSIIGSYLPAQIKQRYLSIVVSLSIIICAIGINMKIFAPKYMYEPDRKKLFTKDDIKFRISKISDEYIPDGFAKPSSPAMLPQAVFTAGPNAKVTMKLQKSTYVSLIVESNIDEIATFHKINFPGWKFFIDGEEVKSDTIQKLPIFYLEKGTHQFEALFGNTPVRSQGNIISIMTVLVLGGLVFYGQKTKT